MSRYQFPSAGTTTTDASLLVSGTLSDARLSSNVALENVANVFSAKQSFSGVDHVGLCLLSLTTAQYNALAATNGDLFRDSTTDRIDARLARGTVELVDTAGGQTIGGNLAATTLMVGGASGPLFRNNAGTIEPRNNANNALANLNTGQVTCTIARTNVIQRDSGDVPLTLYNANFSVPGFCVRGPSGSYLNSSGVTGTLQLNPTINQTGTAGSTDLQINRTETALGSGAHNFADFQVGGVSQFSVSNAGNLTASGTLRVGGGTIVQTILSATATLDFPSIGSNDTATLTITVTGAVAGDSVFLGVPAGLDAGLIFCASVTAANTVTVRMHNSSGGSVDPASGTFRATVIRF